jgi:iron complex outermembrane receptor protein
VKIKSFALFTCLLFFNCLVAQQRKLTIHITDESNKAIDATAVLYRLPDSVMTASKAAQFVAIFEVMSSTSYCLILTSSGRATVSKTINVSDADVELFLQMTKTTTTLSDFTVIAKKPLIREEDDKTIVDPAPLVNTSTNAFEVLEKTPGAIVDQDGNVYLTSTTPATVFINGREMRLSSADLASLLKSLPANSISKIEILRTPSAKYDAASSGGIVNIVLKKGVRLGSSGSVNMAYFQGVYSTATAGFTFNKGADKTRSYISYQYTKKNSFEELVSDRFFDVDQSQVSQQSYTTYPTNTHYISGGTDVALNKSWTLGYDTRWNYGKNQSRADNSIGVYRQDIGSLLGQTSSIINNETSSYYWTNSINTKYKIDTSGSEWTSSVDYNIFRNNNEQRYNNLQNIPVISAISGDGTGNNSKQIFNMQTDFVWKLPSKYTLEAGLKNSISKSNNTTQYYVDSGNGIRQVDLFQTNTYKFSERISAAYLQVSKTFFGFTLKPGLRMEHTDITGRQLVPGDTSFGIKRTDFFPYVYLKHKLFNIFNQPLMASAIYRKSIRRPYYESLNPYRRYIDQFLYEAGNPSLRPQFTTNYEFSVTFNDIPVAAIGVNQTRDIFSNVIYQDDKTKIAFRTFDNLGRNKEIYARLIAGIPPGGKYFFYIGGVYNYNEYRGFFQNQPFNYNIGSITLFTFHEVKLTPTFIFNTQAFFRSRALQNFYELKNFGGMVVSFNKSLLKRKANLILSVNDVFRTNYNRFNFSRNGQNVEGTRINDTRRVGVTLRYNFGIKPKEERKQGFETPQEAKEN